MELFPDDRREITATVDSAWPRRFATFRVDATGHLLPDPASASPAGATSEIIVWTIPWPPLTVLAGLALFAFCRRLGRRRRGPPSSG